MNIQFYTIFIFPSALQNSYIWMYVFFQALFSGVSTYFPGAGREQTQI